MNATQKKRAVWIVLPLLLGGFGLFLRHHHHPSAPPFVTKPVVRGTLHRTVTATGRLKAMKTVHVGAQVSGIITRINVDFNSRVTRGEILAQIDPAIYQAQVAQAESSLSKISTKISLDKIQMVRDRDLLAHHIIARSTYDTDRAQLMMDLATKRQLSAALNLARTDLSYTTIRSPIDGVVIARKVQIGQTVTSAFKTPRLFTIVHDLRMMRLDTRVSEADIGAIVSGLEVSFRVPAYPDRLFRGAVTVVRDHPRTVSHVVTYDVLSTVPNPDEALKPGMTATVTIHTGEINNALTVPNGALVYRPPSRYLQDKHILRARNVTYVFLLKRKGTGWSVVPVAVTVGATDGLVSQVTGGVAPGETVIVRDKGEKAQRDGLIP
ncbi:MAG: efflux RND transporter periplasmic adaptor subunit [Leptospirillia bacterium]